MSETLKPCPFCGGADIKSGGDDKVVAFWCATCEATGPNQYGSHEWNTRAESAELSRLRAEVEAKDVRCDGCGSPWTSTDLARERAADPQLKSCCPERKPLDIDQWRSRALAAEQALAQAKPLAEFVRWALTEGSFRGYEIDGGAAQDKAESLGLIIKTAYDPSVHGENADVEPGGDWFVFAPALRALPSEPVNVTTEGK